MATELQPCGHPAGLLVKSGESDHTHCELCECRKERDDALTMEACHRRQLDTLRDGIQEIIDGPLTIAAPSDVVDAVQTIARLIKDSLRDLLRATA